MSRPGPRRRAREAALQILFAADSRGGLDEASIDRTYDEVVQEFPLPAAARERARELARGVVANLKAIDERIAGASTHWKVYRLATVDRNVLRVAVYELLFDRDVPVEVVIDEAVEVARRFSGDAAPAFVNGLLDVIARTRGDAPE